MTKKHRIRIGIIVVIICMISFPDRSLADEATTNNDIKFLGRSLNMVVGRLSWLWIIFAKIAGELLTNKWVYGEVIGLDSLLRKYWNVVKNFANFGLGFYFVYVVFKGLIGTGKDSIEKILKNTLLRLLIAGIGIQASWFLTAAVIDLSTIAMSAAGSFPSMVISKSPYVGGEVEQSISEAFDTDGDSVPRAKVIEVEEGKNKGQYVRFMTGALEIPKTRTELLQALQPQPEDVSGPLYFIGFSILNIKDITTINTTNENKIKATILNTIIQGGATIIYGIEMAVLCIVAIMRVLYLWMFIMISPIAILLRCIQQSGEKLGGSSKGILNDFMTQLNFETFLINVFKPAIVVLGLGVAAIFAGLMSNIVTKNRTEKPFEYKGVTFSSYANTGTNTTAPGEFTYTSTMEHDLFRVSLENVGKTFLEVVLSILTVILVYQIIKVAMTMGNGKDFVGKRISSIQESVGKVLGSTPIIPVKGYDKEGAEVTRYIGANKVFGLGGTESLLERKIRGYENEITERTNKDTNIIRRWFNEDTPGVLSAEDTTEIQNAMRDPTILGDNLQKTKTIIDRLRKTDKNGKGMTLNGSQNPLWKNEFTNWLDLMSKDDNYARNINKGNGFEGEDDRKAWIEMIKRWKENDKNKTLRGMFGDSSGVSGETKRKAYLRFFFPDVDEKQIEIMSTSTNFSKFMNFDISKPRGETQTPEEGEDAADGEKKDDNSGGNPPATPGGGDAADGGG